jgi:hypothetical protein
MSYLKGPLKKLEISSIMNKQKKQSQSSDEENNSLEFSSHDGLYESYNTLDNSISQSYEIDPSGQNIYVPTLGAKAKVGFFNLSRGIDEQQEMILSLPLRVEDSDPLWQEAEKDDVDFDRFPSKSPQGAKLRKVPNFLLQDRGLRASEKALSDMLYREKKLELYRIKSPKMESKSDESLGDFKVRVQDSINNQKEEAIEKLKEQYSKKEATLSTRLKRAMERVEKEESDVSSKTTDTLISAGMAIFGALLGKSSSAKIGTTISKGSRVLKEKGDVGRAQKRVDEVQEQIDELAYELEDKIDALDEKYSLDEENIEIFAIKPRRSDVVVDKVSVVWRVER